MDQIKKIRSKFSKKVSAGSKPRRDPKLRHSRSLPLRNSSDTDTSYERPRPVYRGEHPLKISDIHHVIDISPQSIADYENPQSGWPRPRDDGDDDRDISQTDGASHHSRRPLIDKEIVDKFPAPPTNTPTPRSKATSTTKPARPLQRPPTMNMDDFNFANDLLPEMNPVIKAKLDATRRYRQEELRREQQARDRREYALRRNPASNPSLGRSASSVSAYTRAPSASPLSKITLDRRNAICSPSSISLASNTMSTPATVGIYRNPISSQSTHSVAHSARRGHQGSPNPTAHSISHPQPLVPNRRRNPSNTSNLSTQHSAGPSPLSGHRHPSASSQQQGGQSTMPDLYHPSVMRVLRGPHGANLQCPQPTKPGRIDVAALEVNDAEEGQEWGVPHGGAGAKYHRGQTHIKPMAATIAGYGRAGMRS